jgi:hypothetical protein
MNVRQFDWRDLTNLHRNRNNSVFLNSALVLTKGPMLISSALVSYFAPTTGVFTYVCRSNTKDKTTLIGQGLQHPGSQLAQMTFITPHSALDSLGAQELVEYLVFVIGKNGAFHLMADVEESGAAYVMLRRVNFSVYTRQRVWKIPLTDEAKSGQKTWRGVSDEDTIAVTSLYNDLVPQLVRQVEPYSAHNQNGLLQYDGDTLAAYAEVRSGLRGIWVQPFVHPGVEDISKRFQDLLREIPNRFSRPVYVCVRSYQSWLEGLLENMGAEAGPRQAVMVKHMAAPQKAEVGKTLPALEGSQPEITAPFSHIKGE